MRRCRGILLALLVLAGLTTSAARAQPGRSPQENSPRIVGAVQDRHGQPVPGAVIELMTGTTIPITETISEADGSYVLRLPESISPTLSIWIERPHFQPARILLNADQTRRLRTGESLSVPAITLLHRIDLGFWVATLAFALMLALIASGRLPNTLASLLSVALLFASSYLGGPLRPDLFIFNFQDAVSYVDWNVIFLIMGMMMVVAMVERTGLFQWMAYRAYRISTGRPWLLLIMLIIFTSVASAFLDNVTTMLLVAPLSVELALALDINPLALLLPEIMASNVSGISTLIGTPTNILIASSARLSFTDFLVNQTPGVLLALAGLIGYSLYVYRKDLRRSGPVSREMQARIRERATIKQPGNLKRAGIVGAGMLILFMRGEGLHQLSRVGI